VLFRSAFGYQPRQQQANGQARGDWKNRNRAPEPVINRAAPPPKIRTMERVLLALMINHPALFDQFGERFAAYDMRTAAFAPIHRKLVDLLSDGHDTPPNAAELRRALSDSGEERIYYEDDSGVLDEILSHDSYTRAKGAHPDADQDAAVKAWRDTWSMHELEQLRAEHAAARQRYADDQSDENYQRMLALQAQINQAQLGGD
jgi:DNA primase